MCGLTGYYSKSHPIENSKPVLEMLKIQKHRGPDDSGVLGINMGDALLEELPVDQPKDFTSTPDLVFGFNRLSILDVSPAGHQPMIHHESKVALMMNGEVYNAFDFKPELEKSGFQFKGHSDTEVVLALYLAYGLDGMLERLNGMFALSIYDGRKNEWYLVRDRLGIKPLYVLNNSSYLAFSSEMKSFKNLPEFKFELDKSKLSEFLLFRNSINHTLFKDIINLTPGTYWKIGLEGEIDVNTYYDIREEGTDNPKLNRKELENALRNSVKRQMISDVKLGSQLSGGVDSSLVTALATEVTEKGSLETVSIVFDDARFSEKKYIDEVAKSFKLKSHQFTLNAEAYLDLLDEAVWHFEQPINHPNTVGIKLLSREAKKHVTVLLSGEGADESLAGYDRFLPDSKKRLSINILRGLIKNRSQLGSFIKLMFNAENRYILKTAYSGMGVTSKIYSQFSVTDAMKSRIGIWESIKMNPQQKKRKYELISYLPDLLMRQDKMSMAHSIENRVPFLDNEMIDTVLNISDDLLVKQKNGRLEGKWLLKEICSEMFNSDFAYRNKMGFSIPLKRFFSSNSFKERWENEILPGIKRRGIFDADVLQKWMRNPSDMNGEQLDAIWLMLGFEIWSKQYLD